MRCRVGYDPRNTGWPWLLKTGTKQYAFATQKEAEGALVVFVQTGVPPFKVGVCKTCNEKFSMNMRSQLYCRRKCKEKDRNNSDKYKTALLRNPALNKDEYIKYKDVKDSHTHLRHKKAQVIAETLNISVTKARTLVGICNLLLEELGPL